MRRTARTTTAIFISLALMTCLGRVAWGEAEPVDEPVAGDEARTIGVVIEAKTLFIQTHYLSGAVRDGEVAYASRDIFHRLLAKFPESYSIVLLSDEKEIPEHWGRLRFLYSEQYHSPYRLDYTAELSFSCRQESIRTNYDAVILHQMPCSAQDDSPLGEINDCIDRFLQNLPPFNPLP